MTATLLLALWAAQFPAVPPTVVPLTRMAYDDGQDAMNSRLFRTTTLRTQIDLGGWWDFAPDPKDTGQAPPPETKLWVPGTWNSVARYWNYVGPAWYQRQFELAQGGHLRLHFGSAFYRTKVWFDGRLLPDHEGGYLPFDFILKGVAKGSHTILVRVDNRLDEHSLPKRNVDWFPYGGLDRPVYAELVPEVRIDRFHVTALADGAIKVKVFLSNLGGAVSEKVVFYVDGRQVYSGAHEIAAGTAAVEFSASLGRPRLWSPAEPNLYSARVVLERARDDQFTRFGVRSLRAEKSKILLNGAPFKLMGANRHEDHPDWGSASPPHIIRQDIEILKRLGANAVRAHYPLPELFMDYCDSAGLAFMSEVPAWQYTTGQLKSAAVQKKMLGQFEQMVSRDMNHPSVITWSLGNEWPKPDESYDVVKVLVAEARKFDGGRLITFTTGGPSVWRVHELIDVISVNWGQYQWYDPFTTLDAKEGEKSIADLARLHARYPDRPVIMTEFGGAESQAGWHNWGNVKWSEEFQARNVEDSGRHALTEDWISGGCVWQFSDTRSAPERFLAGRLRGWNGKGVVDAHRGPKLAFYNLQRLFHSIR